MLDSKTCVCPCGNTVAVPAYEDGYDVCNVHCEKCGRLSSGGNAATGEVCYWNTAREIAQSQAIYEQQMYESDMNEWYGRGEW
jgi:hypothetical protein